MPTTFLGPAASLLLAFPDPLPADLLDSFIEHCDGYTRQLALRPDLSVAQSRALFDLAVAAHDPDEVRLCAPAHANRLDVGGDLDAFIEELVKMWDQYRYRGYSTPDAGSKWKNALETTMCRLSVVRKAYLLTSPNLVAAGAVTAFAMLESDDVLTGLRHLFAHQGDIAPTEVSLVMSLTRSALVDLRRADRARGALAVLCAPDDTVLDDLLSEKPAEGYTAAELAHLVRISLLPWVEREDSIDQEWTIGVITHVGQYMRVEDLHLIAANPRATDEIRQACQAALTGDRPLLYPLRAYAAAQSAPDAAADILLGGAHDVPRGGWPSALRLLNGLPKSIGATQAAAVLQGVHIQV